MSDESFFFEVVRAAFSKRRKTVLNSLGSYRGISESLQEAGIDCGIRPERLGIDDFARLADLLRSHNMTARP